MTHRVHTILSLLAEDHAPAALRPSILLAVDWPAVAEEAPATGDDAHIAYIAATLIGGNAVRDILVSSLGALASLAARLATVAASLTATGDKAMAAHATALWGAAAALVGMPSAAPPVSWGAEMNRVRDERDAAHSTIDALANAQLKAQSALDALAIKAADIVPGVIASGPAEKATLIATALDRVREYRNSGAAEAFGRGVKIRAALGIAPGADILDALAILRETLSATNGIDIMSAASMQAELLNLARQGRDRALADIHALRDILKVPEDGNLVDHASAFAERYMKVRDIFDKALGTTKGATTFTLADIAEEMALQREGFKRERDASDRVLGKVRTALGWEMGKGMLSDFAAEVRKQANEADSLRAENTRLRAQIRQLRGVANLNTDPGSSTYAEWRAAISQKVDRMSAAMREDAPTSAKPRPQPGDVVPWADVEAGALYYRTDYPCPFRVVTERRSAKQQGVMSGPDDCDLESALEGSYGGPLSDIEDDCPAVLVACDLGADPEAWRKAMREWTANGNKPAPRSQPGDDDWRNGATGRVR